MPNKFDIKEKNPVENRIKLLDKNVIYTKKEKNSILGIKNKETENIEQQEDINPSRYGINKITDKAEMVTNKGIKEFNRYGMNSVKNYKQTGQQIKNVIQKTKAKIKEIKQAEEKIKKTKKVVKTSHKTSKKVAKTTVKNSKRAYNFAKKGLKVSIKTTKLTIKTMVKVIKAIASGIKALASIIAGGGWIAVVVILVIIIIFCMIGAFVSFFTNGEDGKELPKIVQIAKVEVEEDKIGGQKYWRWYGFENRVEWCAIFVSWCANESSCLKDNKIPKYAVCDDGISWFKEKNEWADRENYIPKPRRYNIF